MVFGFNNFIIENKENGFQYSFNTYDALKLVSKDAPDIQVAPSAKWKERNKEKLEKYGKVTTIYDWTYETPYQGDIISEDKSFTINDDVPAEQGIPLTLLRKNEPIKKYFEIHLFEDELADNGIAQAVVRCVCIICLSLPLCCLFFLLRESCLVIGIAFSDIGLEWMVSSIK